jgi:integrase
MGTSPVPDPETPSGSGAWVRPPGRVEFGSHVNGLAARKRPRPGIRRLSPDATPIVLSAAEAARLWRDAMKDKSYRVFPLGLRAGDYLRTKHDFFRHHQLRANMQGDPTLAIERAKKRDVHRETIPPEDRAKLLPASDDLRDRVCLRLLLDYGIRKGSLQAIQYRHFDHQRRRLILVVAKGGKVRELPIPDKDLWLDLERLILDVEAQPHDYLLCRQKTIPFGVPDAHGIGR